MPGEPAGRVLIAFIDERITFINPGEYHNGDYCVIDNDERTVRFCVQSLSAER